MAWSFYFLIWCVLLYTAVLSSSVAEQLRTNTNTQPSPAYSGSYSSDSKLENPNHSAQFHNNYERNSKDPPNIVFILADDMGYGDVHYNGGNAETPNLDAMASGEHSIELTRCYSGGPVCSPTRGTVLTGRNNNRYCIWEANLGTGCGDNTCPQLMPLPTSEITVAEILKNHGYRTAAFGKWHLGDLDPCPMYGAHPVWPVSHPGMHGFDTWWMTDRVTPTLDPNCDCFYRVECVKEHQQTKICRNYHSTYTDSGYLRSWPEVIRGDDSMFLFQQFKEFLEEVVKNGERFFVYLAFHTPHAPFIATDARHEYYMQRGFSSYQAHYYGAISGLDEAVGRLRALLTSTGVNKNTMVWFTSDNGPVEKYPGSTAGLRGWKGTLFEGGIRVPGIIEWPALIQGNRKSDYPIVTSDLLPTVCDLLGVSPPDDRDIDGISILPMIAQESTERNQSILFMHGVYSEDAEDHMYFETDYQTAIVNNRYKLHVNYKSGKPKDFLLYDLVEDRQEKSDISKKMPDVVAALKAEVEEWRQSVRKSAVEEVQCIQYSQLNTCPNCSSISQKRHCDPR